MSEVVLVLVRGAKTSHRLSLPPFTSFTVGSGEGADLRVHEEGVEAEHATLFFDNTIGLRALARDVALLSGPKERAVDPGSTVDLELGAVVRVGSVELSFVADPEAQLIAHLLTRHAFRELLKERAKEHDRGLTVLRLRLGAKVQSESVEAVLARALRSSDVATDLAGGDFAVLFGDGTDAQVNDLVQTLAQALEGLCEELLVGSASRGEGEPSKLLELAEERLAPPSVGGARAGVWLSDDPEMRKLYTLVERVAQSQAHVLVLGETGVGKDVIAQMIHDRSPRAAGPFVRVNCVELDDAFFEEGEAALLTRARGGTVHLDEVGGLSPRAQLGLGRLLDEAGLDVRFVASSNQDLAALSQSGGFRKDLFFRLNKVALTVPPLRLRASDVVPLAELFLSRAAPAFHRPKAPRLSEGAKRVLSDYAWPGNVRELKNVVERALLLCSGDSLGLEHLPPELSESHDPLESTVDGEGAGSPFQSLREEIAALEKKRILEALRKYPTQRDAAAALDIPMRTFLNRLDALGIPRARGGGKKESGEEE